MTTTDQRQSRMATRRRLLLGCLVAAYCFATGAAVGVLIERVRFDGRRAAVLAQYETLSARLRDRLMAIEKALPRPATAER